MLKNTRRTGHAFLVVLIAARIAMPVHAQDNAFYLCSTKVNSQNNIM